ncbi:DUF2913 family protein [Providencia rettgeri]
MTANLPTPVSEKEKQYWLGKLAFAALVALKLTQRDGKTPLNPQAENLFLLRWLQTALKQKRFHRCVAHDFEWLINLGQQRLMGPKLKSQLEYLWRVCCCDIASQSDVFRLTAATQVLKNLGWDSVVLSDEHWDKMIAEKPHRDAVPTFYVAKTALTAGFNDEGQQVNLVNFWVLGEPQQFSMVMKQYHHYGHFDDALRQYHLFPSQ